MSTRAAFIAGVAAVSATLRAASAALALPAITGDAEAAQRAIIAAILPFDDPTFAAHVDLERVISRIGALFAPLDDPAYRAAVLVIGSDQRGPAEAYRAWFSGDDERRRRFALAAKSMAMIAVYSDAAIWPAIGYSGPVLRR
jgi:hypothetical protein